MNPRLIGIFFFLILLSGCASIEKKEVIKFKNIPIASNAFEQGGTIPEPYTCDGEDTSPALMWNTPPEGTKSLALIMEDPDAPGRTFIHWVIYNIPPSEKGLEEGVSKEERLGNNALQGVNDMRRIGYNGPCPPPGGPHRYYFKLYALDRELDISPGSTKTDVEKAIEGHILGKGELMGRYGR
jgi:Raf kinase inhibitor-like YbhB/YbcL family protein